MNRAIKFRAWNALEKRFAFYDFLFTSSVKTFAEGDWNLSDLEQFTGILDKNGKEIYEGDILRDKFGGIGQINFANYEDKSGGFHRGWHLRFIDGSVSKFPKTMFSEEVIGNVHENPELLDPTFFPPKGSVSLHEDEDNELYDLAKDPSLEKEEQEPIPF